MAEVELGPGVATLIARMKTHPEEFFGEAVRWRFMFKENFREVLTEVEKGMLHEALRAVRRQELDALVMRTLLRTDEEDESKQAMEGMRLDSSGRLGISSTSGQQQASNKKAGKWLP